MGVGKNFLRRINHPDTFYGPFYGPTHVQHSAYRVAIHEVRPPSVAGDLGDGAVGKRHVDTPVAGAHNTLDFVQFQPGFLKRPVHDVSRAVRRVAARTHRSVTVEFSVAHDDRLTAHRTDINAGGDDLGVLPVDLGRGPSRLSPSPEFFSQRVFSVFAEPVHTQFLSRAISAAPKAPVNSGSEGISSFSFRSSSRAFTKPTLRAKPPIRATSLVMPTRRTVEVTRVMRSRLEPIKAVARSIRNHRELILNWFKAKKEFNSGIVEGLNYKIKLTLRKAYGYRSLEVAEIALYHALGHLPEPNLTHEFC